MCIYYTIHSITKSMEIGDEGQYVNRGARNCRTFMLGTVIYIGLYMWLKFYSIKHPVNYGILMSGFILLLIADLSVMAYLYRAFYGRLIMNEIVSNDEDDHKWKFDEKTHKYTQKTDHDYKIEHDLEEIKEEYQDKAVDNLRKEMKKAEEKLDQENS
jgi:hypothetical protein